MLPYTYFSVYEIMDIGDVNRTIATLLYNKLNGLFYNTGHVIRDGVMVWDPSINRQDVEERMEQCKRKLKTWRRKEYRERNF